MAFSPEALKTARESGYSDDEILSHLATTDPRFAKANEAGYGLDEVAAHFAQTATGAASQAAPASTSASDAPQAVPQQISDGDATTESQSEAQPGMSTLLPDGRRTTGFVGTPDPGIGPGVATYHEAPPADSSIPDMPPRRELTPDEQKDAMKVYLKGAPEAAGRDMPVSTIEPGATEYAPRQWEGYGLPPEQQREKDAHTGMVRGLYKTITGEELPEIEPQRTMPGSIATNEEILKAAESNMSQEDFKTLMQRGQKVGAPPVLAGLYRGVTNFIDGMTTPTNLALLMSFRTAPEAIANAARIAFAAQGAQAVSESGAGAVRAARQGDYSAAAENMVGAAGGVMMVAGGAHRGRVAPELRAVPTPALSAVVHDPVISENLHPEIRKQVEEELRSRQKVAETPVETPEQAAQRLQWEAAENAALAMRKSADDAAALLPAAAEQMRINAAELEQQTALARAKAAQQAKAAEESAKISEQTPKPTQPNASQKEKEVAPADAFDALFAELEKPTPEAKTPEAKAAQPGPAPNQPAAPEPARADARSGVEPPVASPAPQSSPVGQPAATGGAAIAGPALADESGKILAQGKVGQTHNDLKKGSEDPAVIEAEHVFRDTAGNTLSRSEAWDVAKAAGQIKPESLKRSENDVRPRLNSDDLISTPPAAVEQPPSTPAEPIAAEKAPAEAAVPEVERQPAGSGSEPVFTRDEITVGKPQTSRRKRPTGTDGETTVEINAPSTVLDSDNWHRLGDHSKLRATVSARLDFATGKTPKKTEPVWTANGGTRAKPEVIGRGLTFDAAIELAKDHVESANPKPEAVTSPPDYAAIADTLKAMPGTLPKTPAVEVTPESRQRIVDAYRAEAAKTGFDAVRIADVLENAGYTPATMAEGKGALAQMRLDGTADFAIGDSGNAGEGAAPEGPSGDRVRAWGVVPTDGDPSHLLVKLREAQTEEPPVRETKPAAPPEPPKPPKEAPPSAPSLPKPTARDYLNRDKFIGEDYAGPTNSVVIQVRGLDTVPLGDGKPITLPFDGDPNKAAVMLSTGFRKLVNERGGSLRESHMKATDAQGRAIYHFSERGTGIEWTTQKELDAARRGSSPTPKIEAAVSEAAVSESARALTPAESAQVEDLYRQHHDALTARARQLGAPEPENAATDAILAVVKQGVEGDPVPLIYENLKQQQARQWRAATAGKRDVRRTESINAPHGESELSREDVTPSPTASPDQEAAATDLAKQIDAATAKLPETQRRIVELSRDGKDNDEIAAELGITPGSVKSMKSKAFQTLKKELAKPDPIDQALTGAIEALKIKRGKTLFDPLFLQSVGKPVLRLALEAVRAAYRGGKTIAAAIEDGMTFLREHMASRGETLDEENAREFFGIVKERGLLDDPTARTEPPPQAEPAPAPESSEQSAQKAATSQSSEQGGTPEPTAQTSPGRIVALRMAFTDAQREKMGLPKWVNPGRLTNEAAWQHGQAVLAESPEAGKQLIAEMQLKPRPLEPFEKAILLHEEGLRDTEYHAALDAVNKASTQGEYLGAQIRLDAARDANQEFYDAARASGRASGQSLQAHKLALDSETWTLARMEAAIQARLPFGEKLSDTKHAKLVKEIADLHEQLAAERAKAEAAESAARDVNVKSILDKVLEDIKAARKSKTTGESLIDFGKRMEEAARERLRARSGGRLFSGLDPLDLIDHAQIGASWILQGIGHIAKFTEKLVATYGEEARPFAQEIFDASQQQAEIFKSSHGSARKARGEKTPKEIVSTAAPGEVDQKMVYDLVRARVAQDPGMALDKAKISEIMAGVAEDLQPVQPGITEGEVRDLFAGYGKQFKPLSREELNVKMREMHSASGVVSKLQRAIKGEFPEKIGPPRDRPTPLVRELSKELIRTMRENGLDTRAAEGMIKTAHDARVTRLRNAIEDTERQISNGKRTPETPGVEWTPGELALKDQLSSAKARLDEMLDEPDSDELHRILNRIDAVTDKLSTGKIDPKARSQNVPTKEVSEATDKLAALNKELADRRKSKRLKENPPATEDERKLASLEKQEEELQKKIDTGAIDAATGTPTVDTQEVAAARERVQVLRDQLAEARKAKRIADNPPKTEAEKTLAALEKRNKEARDLLNSGKLFRDPSNPGATNPEIEAARKELHETNRLLSEARKASPDGIRRQQASELESLQRRNRDARAVLASGTLFRKAGVPKPTTREIAAAKAELAETNRLLAAARKASAEGIQRDLENYKRMIARKSAELQQKIDSKDFSKAPDRKASAEKTKAAVPYKLLQEKWESLKRAQELKNQNALQKTLRWTTYLAHEMLLLGSTVGQKLATAAATTAAVVRPLEETAGFVLGKIVPVFAEKGDAEIAPSAKSLVQGEFHAAAQAMLNVISDIGSTLRHGKADFEIEFGKHYDNEQVSYVGRAHGSLKTIPARQAFVATFERLSEKYAARGMDITDPDVRFNIGTQSLLKAQEAKFQDPNLAVGGFKAGLRFIENKNPNVGAVTKAIAKTEMPVMTVASNITWRVFESIYGAPVGGGRIAWKALSNSFHNTFGKKGADFVVRAMNDMSREEVESIARQFKRGSVGAAAFLLGAYMYKNLGGFYQAGENRDKEDVAEEEMRPPGAIRNVIRFIGLNKHGDIPKELIHHSAFTVMQAGATAMQVAQSRLRKADAEEQGIGSGLVSAAIGVAEQAPMSGAVQSISKLFSPYTRNDAIGSFARTLLGISGPVAWLAKHPLPFTHIGGDEDAEGEITKRKARTFGEQLKLGIPGLRKTVPEKQAPSSGGSYTPRMYRPQANKKGRREFVP